MWILSAISDFYVFAEGHFNNVLVVSEARAVMIHLLKLAYRAKVENYLLKEDISPLSKVQPI